MDAKIDYNYKLMINARLESEAKKSVATAAPAAADQAAAPDVAAPVATAAAAAPANGVIEDASADDVGVDDPLDQYFDSSFEVGRMSEGKAMVATNDEQVQTERFLDELKQFRNPPNHLRFNPAEYLTPKYENAARSMTATEVEELFEGQAQTRKRALELKTPSRKWTPEELFFYTDVDRYIVEVAKVHWPMVFREQQKNLGAMSAASFQERVFSTSGNILTGLRTRLNAELFDALLYGRHNAAIFELFVDQYVKDELAAQEAKVASTQATAVAELGSLPERNWRWRKRQKWQKRRQMQRNWSGFRPRRSDILSPPPLPPPSMGQPCG
jgi:hypothetical protein